MVNCLCSGNRPYLRKSQSLLWFPSAGLEINFFRQAPTGNWPFFSVAKWENVGDQLWNSGRQYKTFSRIGDQESAISNPVQSDCHHPWRPQGTSLERDEHVFPVPRFPTSLLSHFPVSRPDSTSKPVLCSRHWSGARDERQAGSGMLRLKRSSFMRYG